MTLKVGDRIPEVLGKDQVGNLVRSAFFKGRKLVLYFYPKDNTPGCTAQACSLRDGYEDLKVKGFAVVGVSVDSEASHQKFIQKYKLPFPLISDSKKELVRRFGVWKEKKSFGRTYMGTVRTTFIVDEEGVIKDIITGRKVVTKNHALQVLDLEI